MTARGVHCNEIISIHRERAFYEPIVRFVLDIRELNQRITNLKTLLNKREYFGLIGEYS